MGRSIFAIGIVPHTMTDSYFKNIYDVIYRKWELQDNVSIIDEAVDVMKFSVMQFSR